MISKSLICIKHLIPSLENYQRYYIHQIHLYLQYKTVLGKSKFKMVMITLDVLGLLEYHFRKVYRFACLTGMGSLISNHKFSLLVPEMKLSLPLNNFFSF